MKDPEKIKQVADYWLKTAENDLKVMDSLLRAGHYDYSLFFGHLCLEKLLKGLYVKINKTSPPFTHDLNKLAKESELDLDQKQILFFEEVNRFNIEVRYPDYRFTFYKKCTPEFTRSSVKKIKECFNWLMSILKS
ncbi:MAG: HEPN domain-containing protein [Deltaproteobacteria bacterium]|nr:HEPN domain-containing protein [Deltaproteobacteria bacterium]